MHELHEKIGGKITQNNANYTLRTDVRNRPIFFNVGDVNKLHASSADPFQILNKLNDNDHVIDFGISFTFNVEYLVDYNGLDLIILRAISLLYSKIFYPTQHIKLIKSWMM